MKNAYRIRELINQIEDLEEELDNESHEAIANGSIPSSQALELFVMRTELKELVKEI